MIQKEKYKGLTSTQVEENRKLYGANILTPPKREPLWKLFLEKFSDPIIRILLVAAFISLGISFLHNEFIETIGIFSAILLATGVAFWFETDANRKFDILNQVNDDTPVKVLRDGMFMEIPKKDIVKDDIIILETGDEIPADAEILESVSLSVNESTLTGEPSIEKSADPKEFDKDSTYPTNHLFRGTTIIEGHCICKVFAVGDSTEFGKVAEKSTEKGGEETPLNKQLEGLAKVIGVVGFTLAVFTFAALFVKDIFLGKTSYDGGQLYLLLSIIAGVIIAGSKVWMPIIFDGLAVAGFKKGLPKVLSQRGLSFWALTGVVLIVALSAAAYLFGVDPLSKESWIDLDTAARVLQYFMVAVTLIVVAVPEGLPMSVTLSLALSMRRMLQTNNLVRKMHACETMGATTVICTDKTGTLTKNQMRVHNTNFTGLENQIPTDSEESRLVLENISVNSTAYLDLSDPEKVRTLGNPTEAALLLWMHSHAKNYITYREESVVLKQMPFSTERKYMATVVKSATLGRSILYVKGAPEIVATKCLEVPQDLNQILLGYQSKAMRTLGFAYKFVDENDETPLEVLSSQGLTYSGIVAISDPVREDVPEAVSKCLSAGIDVKIVTGDTPGTAKEIGRQIGILKNAEDEKYVITGVEFEAMSEEEAEKMVMGLKIMCRARPTDKQRLVRLLQKCGAVVAVTGDGTNDAPALNYAQVGLSMGTGTSVAKEASDITLLDDSFNSIATAVMWGRSLYRNIQRFLLFQLTINVTAMIVVLAGSIFGHELPLTVTQMLWVNLIMDTFAAGALASLPPDERVMLEKPRNQNDFILTKTMKSKILSTAAIFVVVMGALLFLFADENGEISDYNLSVYFTVFVMLQFWNMFNAKRFLSKGSAFSDMKNSKGFLVVSLLIVAGQALIVQFGGEVFRTVPIKFVDWVIIIASTSLVLWIGEIASLIKRRK